MEQYKKSFYLFNPCLPSFHVRTSERMKRTEWKQFLSQLCYCLQNNLYEKEIFISSKAAFFSFFCLAFRSSSFSCSSFPKLSSVLFSFYFCSLEEDKLLEKYLFSPSIDTHAVHLAFLFFFFALSCCCWCFCLMFYFINILDDSFFVDLFGAFTSTVKWNLRRRKT